ncbi:hypothetical protein AURDEDRAFT_127006 [Auricularia subglabra TFB-10046 SS5]|nr:hypothetical protein AURDEDRAFT_127006 [Auricularia subglabra TFB-10046 SS5]
MTALPPELISQFMLCCGQESTQHRLQLSQVCSQWRDVAIGTSQFWSTINIGSLDDLRLLGTFISRSGTAALRVRVEEGTFAPSSAHMEKLNLHADIDIGAHFREQFGVLSSESSRIVSLSIHTTRVRPFEELLRGGLYFPILENVSLDLHVQYDNFDGSTIYVNWFAPALRTMELTNVYPAKGWRELFKQSPLLERLALLDCDLPTGSQLESGLASWAHLKELILVDGLSHHEPDWTAPAQGWTVSSSLRVVDVRLGAQDIGDFLRGFPTVVVPSIAVGPSAYGGEIRHSMDDFLPPVMRGLGRVVEFGIPNENNICIRDEKGNERRLVEDNFFADGWDVVGIWRYLCAHHSAATSVVSFQLTPRNWDTHGKIFAAIPPGDQAQLRLTRALWE